MTNDANGGGNGVNGGGGNGNNANGNAADNRFSYTPPERYALAPGEYIAAATAPLRIVRRRWRAEAPYMLALFVAIFSFYFATASEAVGLEDDGLFIANLHFFGVAHPPGYPAHTFFGGIFYHLFPFGAPAFRAHMFSGLAGAGAGVALYAIVAMLVYGRLFPALAALCFASSKTFWSQSIVAEVYTLNAFLFFTLLALAMRYASQPNPAPRLFYAAAIVAGIGLANHYPLFMLGGVGVALLIIPRLRKKLVMLPLGAGIALATALPFYLWMVWRSHLKIPANFYAQPIDTMEYFWFYILRQGYGEVDRQSGVGLDDKLAFLERFGDDLLWQYTPLGLLVFALGFGVMARTRYNWLWLCLCAAFVCNSLVLLALLDFQARHLAFAVFRVYYILAFGVLAIWLAFGAAWLADRLPNLNILQRRAAGGALMLALVAGNVVTHWQLNNRANDNWAEHLATTKLNSIEPNAVLFLHGDLDFPTMYLHYVKGLRPDLTVYDDQGFLLPNALFSPFLPEFPPPNDPTQPNMATFIRQFITQEPAPVYYNHLRYKVFSSSTIGNEFLGFYRRVNLNSPETTIDLSDEIKTWLQQNLDGSIVITDPWTRFQQYDTIVSAMNAVVQAAEEGSLELTDEWRDIIKTARAQNAQARTLTNLIRIENLTQAELAEEAQWQDGFDINEEPLMDKFGRGRYYFLRARLEEKLNGTDTPAYEEYLLQSMQEDERDSNPSLNALLRLYALDENRHCEYLALIEQHYPDINQISPQRLAQLRAVRRAAVC